MKKRQWNEKPNPELERLRRKPQELDLVLGYVYKKVEKEKSNYRFDWRWYGIAALLSIFCALAAPPNPVAWVGLLGGWISVLINVNVVIRLFKRA
jgi:hypothetical protein